MDDTTVEPRGVEWAAGLFEGEGCFYPHHRENGRVRAFAVLSMTDEDSVRSFHEIVGVGSIFGPYTDYRTVKDGAPRKPQWRWYATGSKAEAVARLLWPYLGIRRRGRIREMMEEVQGAVRVKGAA